MRKLDPLDLVGHYRRARRTLAKLKAENKKLLELDWSIKCLLKSLAGGAFKDIDLRFEAQLILDRLAELEEKK
jgi:hypothetical protein